MTISSYSGLKEFANGDAALFNGTHLIDEFVDNYLDAGSRDDFESEFHRLLTEDTSTLSSEALTTNLSSFESEDLYASPPEFITASSSQEVKFEEDPLSAILNIEQLKQTQSIESPHLQPKTRKRGRPPVIKFKPSNEYTNVSKPHNPRTQQQTTAYPLNQIGQQKLELRERRSLDDTYSPVWIRGRGIDREGLCPLCHPPHWFKIKQSAYWYHMNFYHGISAATGKPYKRPINYRLSGSKVEGHCGNCLQWILLDSDFKGSNRSDLEEQISFTSWYKHAQKCHHRTKEFRIPF